MILLRDYSEEKKLDRVWFSSTNVFYSECEDRENALKVLRVVFNNGATYEYSDVDVNDYMMFIAGGLDGSNGKALNEFVKKKQCPYKRIDPIDKTFLTEEMERIKKERAEATKAKEEEENKQEGNNEEKESQE